MAEAAEPKIDEAIAEAAAEKAYAAAAEDTAAKATKPAKAPKAKPTPVEATPVPVEATVVVDTAPVEMPVADAPIAEAPVAVGPVVELIAAAPVVAEPVIVAAAPAKIATPKLKKAPVAKKALAVKRTAKPVQKITKKAAPKQPAPITFVRPAALAAVKLPSLTKLKETIMAKTTEDFTAKVKEAATEMQDRAKAAFEKSSATLSEVGEFSKGNVEALVEAGKILAAGLQDIGKGYVAEGKTAFETVTADVKELSAIKSPADFFKLQGEILRRNFDAAVATGSKTSEMFVKLASDTYAPLSSRVSLAVEKVKQAA